MTLGRKPPADIQGTGRAYDKRPALVGIPPASVPRCIDAGLGPRTDTRSTTIMQSYTVTAIRYEGRTEVHYHLGSIQAHDLRTAAQAARATWPRGGRYTDGLIGDLHVAEDNAGTERYTVI